MCKAFIFGAVWSLASASSSCCNISTSYLLAGRVIAAAGADVVSSLLQGRMGREVHRYEFRSTSQSLWRRAPTLRVCIWLVFTMGELYMCHGWIFHSCAVDSLRSGAFFEKRLRGSQSWNTDKQRQRKCLQPLRLKNICELTCLQIFAPPVYSAQVLQSKVT